MQHISGSCSDMYSIGIHDHDIEKMISKLLILLISAITMSSITELNYITPCHKFCGRIRLAVIISFFF